MNVGTTAFHNLTIELLKAALPDSNASPLPKEPGREPIVENDRVRVFRLSLAPGESAPTHTHPLPGLAIAITAGELDVATGGNSKPERTKVAETDVRWRAGAVTHSIKNVGKTRFEGIDIEFK
jgi:quercetin dioxygenase-like cupin family protein